MDGAGVDTVNGVTVQAVRDGDQSGSEATAGVYSFDITDLQVSDASATSTTINLKVGIVANTVTVALTDGKASAASIAAAITATQMVTDNVTYGVTVTGTKVTLTQAEVPTSTNEYLTAATANMQVSFTAGKSEN